MATSVTEEAPLTALEARSTDCTYLKNRVPITITLELAPTGDMSSFVSVGPAPRSTMPLSIWIALVTLKVPAESWTTWPSGQASTLAWIPAVASALPLP